MRVVEVTYERLTKHRVGQYENERAACTVRVEEGEPAAADGGAVADRQHGA